MPPLPLYISSMPLFYFRRFATDCHYYIIDAAAIIIAFATFYASAAAAITPLITPLPLSYFRH
jgi:hypothetical protein